MSVSKKNFNISKLVENVYETHAYSAAQKGLRFTFSVSHKLPRVLYGDLQSVQQALSVLTQIAIEDSLNGAVEINVDLQNQSSDLLSVKFTVSGSEKAKPYWFSVSLEASKAKQTA